jgi:hypothetical protein
VHYREADKYMASVFKEWLKHFPVPSYTESDDPDEQEYIAKVVIKVCYFMTTDEYRYANIQQGMRNYLRWIVWSKDKAYEDWQDDIKKKLGH